ncbi:hypothetical protein QVD17_23216 [Tagetes erecta]|uniref:RRM domain-containing protein n=1 Tax=Tagetes erecta TaxID=13708 RepID=A0AAD8NM54_TARER|nr:hypothetical protein QVD17_23216 [Tagetes erecta]
MAAISLRKGNTRLPPEVNRVLYVRNLPFNITSEEMYDIFGKYGAIRQIRIGTNKDTRGTAFVVYEDIYDAKTAVDHLSGFNVANRYLIVLYYQHAKMSKKFDQKKKEEELTKLQEKYGVTAKDLNVPILLLSKSPSTFFDVNSPFLFFLEPLHLLMAVVKDNGHPYEDLVKVFSNLALSSKAAEFISKVCFLLMGNDDDRVHPTFFVSLLKAAPGPPTRIVSLPVSLRCRFQFHAILEI